GQEALRRQPRLRGHGGRAARAVRAGGHLRVGVDRHRPRHGSVARLRVRHHGERRGRRARQEATRRHRPEGPPPAGRRRGRSVDPAARRRAAGAATLDRTAPPARWVDKPARGGDHPTHGWLRLLRSHPAPRHAAAPADTALRRARLLLGYAGWGPGQLDAELTASAWLTAPPEPSLVFETPPAEMWERAIRGLGVDPMALQLGAGIQ